MWEFEEVLEEALEDARAFGPELLHLGRREIYSDLDITPYGLRSVPTHTEDGIPIRKLYITNLPPKTSRTELFGVYAQYGFIKSCWLRLGDRGTNKLFTPTYAFVTFSDPADAHKALLAPDQEKMLRGYKLKTYPADSWHQPAEDSEGHVQWRSRGSRKYGNNSAQEQNEGQAPLESSSDSGEATSSLAENAQADTEDTETEKTYTILDILNRDCLSHVLTYVPIIDLIRSERVSKHWRSMIQEHIDGIRKFKTSWWQHGTVTLTTAVLRRVLQRLGPTLTKLHIDHHWSALNDRTAHTVGKFCPNLEELKVVGMYTKNWNPLIYGCKKLRALSFVSCNKLMDSSLVRIVKGEASIESVSIANNTQVTGLFLTGTNPPKLHTLAFYNCCSLQGTVLSAAIDSLPNLRTLKLDVCPVNMWKIVPLILSKLPKLEELSLSEYTSMDVCLTPQVNIDFCESLSKMTELKVLNLSRNIYITNAILKQVATTCTKLESLNISSCNTRKINPQPGVSDEGVLTICRSCVALRRLNISYLALLTDAGAAAAARCAQLVSLIARGNASLTAAPFAAVLDSCSQLQELDVCGCDSVSEQLVSAATDALAQAPRPLTLRMGGTAALSDVYKACSVESYPTHKLLLLTVEDLSNPHLRPDFVDRIFEDSSDDSLNDPYDPDNFDVYLGSDDDLFMDDDELDYDDALYAYGLHAPDLLLM